MEPLVLLLGVIISGQYVQDLSETGYALAGHNVTVSYNATTHVLCVNLTGYGGEVRLTALSSNATGVGTGGACVEAQPLEYVLVEAGESRAVVQVPATAAARWLTELAPNALYALVIGLVGLVVITRRPSAAAIGMGMLAFATPLIAPLLGLDARWSIVVSTVAVIAAAAITYLVAEEERVAPW